MVASHFAGNFVISVHFIQTIRVFDQKVGDRWMMTSMFTIKLGAINELSLKCFTKYRVKWLVLSTTHVDATASEGNN